MLNIFNMFLASTGGEGDSNNSWLLIVGIGFIAVMFVMSIIPQRKRQKQAQQMMESIKVGCKIKTIGGLIGKIVQINNDDGTMILDIGTSDSSTFIVVDKAAMYMNLSATNATQNNSKATTSDTTTAYSVDDDKPHQETIVNNDENNDIYKDAYNTDDDK